MPVDALEVETMPAGGRNNDPPTAPPHQLVLAPHTQLGLGGHQNAGAGVVLPLLEAAEDRSSSRLILAYLVER